MGIFSLNRIFVNWGSLSSVSLVMGNAGEFLGASPGLYFWSPGWARPVCAFLQLLVGPSACKAKTHGRNSHCILPAAFFQDDFFPGSAMSVFTMGTPKLPLPSPFLLWLYLLLKLYDVPEVAAGAEKLRACCTSAVMLCWWLCHLCRQER